MYGKFEYKGKTFRWELSSHLMTCCVYSEDEIIGRLRIKEMEWRDKKSAFEAFYPVCDRWLERKTDKGAKTGPGCIEVADETQPE